MANLVNPPAISTATDVTKPASVADLKREFGIKYDTLESQYKKSEQRIDEVDKGDYRKMWQNDGQVSAIVKLPQLLILGAGFEITGGDEEMEEEVEFIKENLLNASFKGGMTTPIEGVIEDMTYAPFEGVRFYELVFKAIEGKIRLHKIASRDNITCFPATDENGEFTGFYQRAQLISTVREVFIPKNKAIAIIFNEAFGGLNGLSLLKAAWYHWDKKHKLYFISHLAAELQTIPVKVLYNKSLNDTAKAAVEAAIDEIGLQSRLTIPEGQGRIEELAGSGTPNVNIKELIDHHNSLISKSLLAQFIDLSSETSSTGSNALGTSMIDLYLNFIGGLVLKIESAFNNDIIPKLIDYNFGSGKYPQFKINEITKAKQQLILEIFKEMAIKDTVGVTTKNSLLEKVSGDLGLEFDENELIEQEKQKQEQANKEMEMKQMALTQKNAPQDPNLDKEMEGISKMKNSKDMELEEDEGDMVQRPLYLDEQKVDFVKQSKQLDLTIANLKAALTKVFNDSESAVINEIVSIVESGNISRLADLQIANKSEIINILDKELRDVYEFAKIEANKELGTAAKPTDSQNKAIVTLGATTNGAKLVDDLKANIINIAKNDFVNGVDISNTRVAVANEIRKYLDNNLTLAAEQNSIGSFNQGLLDVFRQNEEDIVAYRYSAVLDSRTTRYCRSLDGKVFPKDSAYLASITPPNHFRCRSRLIPILKGEDYRATRKAPNTFNSLFDFKDTGAFNQKRMNLNEIEHEEQWAMQATQVEEINHLITKIKDIT